MQKGIGRFAFAFLYGLRRDPQNLLIELMITTIFVLKNTKITNKMIGIKL